jgi:extracellular matrix regulatory protein B
MEIFFKKTRAKLHKKWYNKNKIGMEILLGAGGVCMYLHLGQDVVVPTRSILGIYDMDTATWSKHTRALIASMEKAGRVQAIFDDLPKSCILCEEGGVRTLYISQLSTATLLRRSEQVLTEFSV